MLQFPTASQLSPNTNCRTVVWQISYEKIRKLCQKHSWKSKTLTDDSAAQRHLPPAFKQALYQHPNTKKENLTGVYKQLSTNKQMLKLHKEQVVFLWGLSSCTGMQREGRFILWNKFWYWNLEKHLSFAVSSQSSIWKHYFKVHSCICKGPKNANRFKIDM